MRFEEIENLNLKDLDIDELETRLEMSTLDTEAAPWICGTHGNGPEDPPICVADCAALA